MGTDLGDKILALIFLILLGLPIIHMQSLLIVELPKKLGYTKFFLVVTFFMLIVAICTYLVTLGYSLLTFLIPVLVEFYGVFFLRKEFMEDVRDILKFFKKEKDKSKR
jgi:hypothetical protein